LTTHRHDATTDRDCTLDTQVGSGAGPRPGLSGHQAYLTVVFPVIPCCGSRSGSGRSASVARSRSDAKRDRDLLGRYGGEEFVVLLPGTSASQARRFCERVRDLTQKGRVRYEGLAMRITLSAGVHAVLRPEPDSLERLIARADEALYAAKDQGRNRVVMLD